MPALAIIGLSVAGYLAYTTLTASDTLCGPFGACDVVQTSAYSRLAGIPVAVLGFVFYVMLLGAWLGLRTSRAQAAAVALSAMGVGFSIYLTGLELLVIQAVCS